MNGLSSALSHPRIGLPQRWSFPRHPVFAPGPDAGPAAMSSAPRVLIVEDDHLVAMAIENALLDAGFIVVGVAASAEEAAALARAEKPHLAIMDIRLSGARDGVDAALEIFNETGIRCVFATAHNDSGTRLRAQPAQPLGWVSKPYAPDALVQAVSNGLAELQKSE